MTTEKGEESLSKSIEFNPEADLNIEMSQENDNLPRKNRQFSTTQGISIKVNLEFEYLKIFE